MTDFAAAIGGAVAKMVDGFLMGFGFVIAYYVVTWLASRVS